MVVVDEEEEEDKVLLYCAAQLRGRVSLRIGQ